VAQSAKVLDLVRRRRPRRIASQPLLASLEELLRPTVIATPKLGDAVPATQTPVPFRADPRGLRHDLGILCSPNLVGEISALVHGRTADVTATADVEAVAMDAMVFRDMCIKYPDFAQAFAGLVHQRLAEQETIAEGSSRQEQIQILANVQALTVATPESQGKILAALFAIAENKPDLIRRDMYPASTSEPFIRQGQTLERVFVIVRGGAEVRLPDGRAVDIRAGSPIGEIAALSPTGMATATVFFTEETELLSISREHFRAVREPADELVRRWLQEQFTHPLPTETKEILRSVRDQNIDALILRTALDIVHSGTGIFKHLNPEQAGLAHRQGASGHMGVIRQRCIMISAVASLLKVGKRRENIAGTVDEIKGYALCGIPALKMFKGDAALAREDWIEQVSAIFKPFLPNALSFLEFTTVRERLERLCWLDQLLLRDGALE
jgi:CRP-like cAMP-binding protein